MKKKRIKLIGLFTFLILFLASFTNISSSKVYARDEYHNAYDYYQTYGSDSCRFAVVDNQARIYFNAYGTKGSSSAVRYRTIGWKANLFLNGGYVESVYFSLTGDYIVNYDNSSVGNKEYNLYYIRLSDLIKRFRNQNVIKSGAGEIKLNAVMSIVPPNSDNPNGTINDNGDATGEVYDTYEGISKARKWAHPEDLKTRFNKVPTGMYRTVSVSGGTGISGTSGSGTYIYGVIATISATCSSGYDFNSWDNGKTSSSFYYTVTEDKTFTCTGKPKKYTVSYDANGGTGEPNNQIKIYGSVLILSSTKPTRTGYNFNYWDGSDGKTYNPGAAFGTDADTKLTAHWTPITYYVSYNGNKPDKASSDVTGIMLNSTHAYDNGIKASGYTSALTANAYSLKGWSFINWNLKSDSSGTKYSDNASIKNLTSTDKATITMYAHWKPNVYMLIMDDQNATSSGTSYLYEKYDHGWYKERAAKNSTSTITIPQKMGMKFLGYNSKADGTGTSYVNASGNIVAANNSFNQDPTYVYAQWTPNVYDIELDNQGSNSSGTTHIYEKFSVGFYSNSAATNVFANGKITIPQKDNYIFDGYWTEQNSYKTSYGEQIIKPDGSINNVNTKFTSNSKIFAKWIPKDYKINLDNQGADLVLGSSAFFEKYGEYNYTSSSSYDVDSGYNTKRFEYTGNVQYFTAPMDGEYILKVAGAQGGGENGTAGALGGTSTGTVTLKKGQTLAITVGGKGSFNSKTGGYNGGGTAGYSGPSGGGATHIATNNRGELKNFVNNKNEVLIVAGGGGGSTHGPATNSISEGGSGGGQIGTSAQTFSTNPDWTYKSFATGGTQSSGGNAGIVSYRNTLTLTGENGSFGQGGNGTSNKTYDGNNDHGAGGGGGWYGGGSTCVHGGAGGGSGYINSVVKSGQMSSGSNYGNGWATISYKMKETYQYNVVERFFNYTGDVQTFTAPFDGKYNLEVAGAQGCDESDLEGGMGGVSKGTVTLKKDQKIYIYVGQYGTYGSTKGAYNGGGASGGTFGAGGGGATHIATEGRGELKSYVNNKNEVLIVAGGGGGASADYNMNRSTGGHGGGTSGLNGGQFPTSAGAAYYMDVQAGGGTQTSGGCAGKTHAVVNIDEGNGNKNYNWTMLGNAGSFGQGGSGKKYNGYNTSYSGYKSNYGAGGGGGWYGGGSTVEAGGAGGGSGYIGGVTNGSMINGCNKGDGWARISYVDPSLGDSSVCNIRNPQKKGYTFGGYYTQKEGKGDLVVAENGIVTTSPNYFHEEKEANVNSKGEATVYAFWTKNQYKFNYMGNGGKTSNGKESISDDVTYNTKYHVRATENTFYNPGNKLTGWREKNADGTWGKQWPANTDVTYQLEHNTTVYAQWTPDNVKYTINYYKENLKGNYKWAASESDKNNPSNARIAKTGSIVKVVPTTNKAIFDSTGFTLNKDKSCTGSNQQPESKDSNGYVSVKILGDGSTVVNYYYSRNSYKLTLKVATGDKGFAKLTGAGDTGTNNTWIQNKKYGESVTIGAELNEDYEFASWKSGGTVFSDTESKTFDMPCKDLTLTASSTKGPEPPVVKYKVTVKHYLQSKDSYTLNKTVIDTVKENTDYVPRTAIVSTGYCYSKMLDDDTQEDVSRGFKVTKDTTVNVYYDRMQYKIVTEHYVDNVLYSTFAENAYYNESYKVKELNLTGYKRDKIVVPIYNTNPFTVKQDMTGDNKIKVYYVPKTYTVTFKANGGNVINNNQKFTSTTKTVKYNNTDNNDVSSLNPTKTGYTFIGWYTEEDKDGNCTQVYSDKGKCTNEGTYWKDNKWCYDSNLTVIAHWKANTYNLTFDANGGFVNDNEKTAKVTPTYDQTFFSDVEYMYPHRTGYTFKGWYTYKTGGTQVYNNKGKCKNEGTYWLAGKWHYAGDVTLYAQWTANKYTVKYDANGGTGTMTSDTVTYDTDYITKANTFKRTGYKFIGWNTQADGKGESWTARIGKTFKWNYPNDIILYAQWQANTAKICYHSEDEKHNITRTYEVDGGQKFETATDWWRKQKFKTAYEPGNCIFAGWTTIKGSTDDMYTENGTVPNQLILDHINGTIDMYSIWDKPTVKIEPTSNNVSFKCNNKTWYKDTIELKATGIDKRYNVIGFDYSLSASKSDYYRTTNKGTALAYTFSTSKYYSGGLRSVLKKGEPFTVKIWSESSTATSGTPMGTSDMSTTQYWIDFTAPGLTYSVDSNHNVKVTATDDESGVNTIDLQSYRNGQWVSVNKATASSSQYSQFTNTFNLTQADYRYRYRVTATDHLGNSKTSGEFYVVPLTLKTALSKLDGTKVYNGQTLEFIAGGDLNATITANIGGYAETVKYEFSNELGQVVDSHTISYAADGNATETKQFLIPWQLPHNQNYFVKVTAYRGNESVSTTEYVKLIDIDFSKFRSNIIYQSGQHN